ncbi:MAG: endonuclease VIII [Xanthomonadales bacterium]|nr:endonuclease VIII [Gammaproteobacteria bacterium]NNK52172.1 endonuclease VIII [Xanthomonadales bacterium]
MPEGPEIRRAADRIAKILVGRRIEQVSFAFPELRPFETTLRGSCVRAIDTHGKAMLTRFENQLTLYSHNQLYGRWFTMPRGELPETRRSLRVALHTKTHSALLYSASDIHVLTPQQLDAHPFLSRLGPDILDEDLEEGDIAERIGQRRFLRRSLASIYLDQGFLAGLGNYLRSEILYCAGLHPKLRPVDLELGEQQRLARATRQICWRSYRTGGVTLSKAQSRGRKERFWVFARASKPCYRCGAKIQRDNFSGRRLYYCPACQESKTT